MSTGSYQAAKPAQVVWPCFHAVPKAVWLSHVRRPLLSKLKCGSVYLVPHVRPLVGGWKGSGSELYLRGELGRNIHFAWVTLPNS